MKGFFHFTINGELHRIEGDSIHATLLDYLREQGLTGTKESCAEGGCGACTVVILEKDSEGRPAYRAALSCLTLLPALADREVFTVEGIARNGSLHPVQEIFSEHFGSQCGFCAPGVVMSLFDAYYRNDFREHVDDLDAITGNLCRCTGYRAQRHGAAACAREGRRVLLESADDEPGDDSAADDDPFRSALRESPSTLMESTGFEYVDAGNGRFYRPLTVTELFRLRQQYGDARLIGGGTSIARERAGKDERFRCLVALDGIAELQAVVRHNGYWEIGSGVSLTQLEEGPGREYRVFEEALRRTGSRQVRNRATVGGALAAASPRCDLAPAFIALECAVRLLSPEGEREVPVDKFYAGDGETILRDDEIVKDLRIPRDVRAKMAKRGVSVRLCRWYKVSRRRDLDEAIVACCFALGLDEEKKVVNARLAYSGIETRPVRARETESFLEGNPWDEETIVEARKILGGEFDPAGDELAGAAYRGGLVVDLFEKFFREFEEGKAEPQPLGAGHEFAQTEGATAS